MEYQQVNAERLSGTKTNDPFTSSITETTLILSETMAAPPTRIFRKGA
jgi:hypothetical protein